MYPGPAHYTKNFNDTIPGFVITKPQFLHKEVEEAPVENEELFPEQFNPK